MVAMERPDWQAVMTYVTSIYKYFELDSKPSQVWYCVMEQWRNVTSITPVIQQQGEVLY